MVARFAGMTRQRADHRLRPEVDLLENVIQEYAWGSRTALASLLGRPEAVRPQAELWMGAHPSAPSKVLRGGKWVSLRDVIERAPGEELGAAVHRAFGARLPFLLKVLAAESPLSLQAHPSAEQAKAGFAREEAAGIPRSAPERNYRDDSSKPELLCALTEFEALCGFRAAGETLRLFQSLAVAELLPLVGELAAHPDGGGVRAVFEGLVQWPAARRAALLDATLAVCERLAREGGPFARECRWAVKLGGLYPGDIGAVNSLLLNRVLLQPGQGVFLPAGKLHAYLHGMGVEIMGNSDNVLRGGLTPKHVDVPELFSVLDFRDGPVMPLSAERGAGGEERYVTPAAEFRLSRLTVAAPACLSLKVGGPEILLCTEGALELRGARGTLALERGQSAWVPASEGTYGVVGSGTAYRATTG